MLRKLIRWAITTAAEKGDSQQVTYFGKVANSAVHYPLGFHASAPNQTLCLMFSVNGHPENRVVLPMSTTRPEIEQGEVVVFHPTNPDQQVLFKNDGSIEITATKLAITGDVTINGSLAVTGGITDAGIDVGSTHVHGGVQSGSNSTGTPV